MSSFFMSRFRKEHIIIETGDTWKIGMIDLLIIGYFNQDRFGVHYVKAT